jgi:YidC/Oxa1 family membrane protein insertase
MQIILTPFSWLLTAFYNLFHSYGFALILFAIVVKLILFPFSLKGKKGMIQMNMLNGKVQQIQKQYANNKEKMNEEVQKLYAKEKVNPMSGCLWSFIPILILWPLYAIIRRPFYYMMGQSVEAIQAIADTLGFVPTSGTVSTGYNELKLAGLVTLDNLDAVKAAADSVTAGLGDKIFHINFNFLGLNLADVPQWKFWEYGSFTWAYIGLLLMPIISAALGFVMTLVSQKTNNMNNSQANAQMNQQTRTMMIVSPLISLWIGYVMPAGLCVYWIINNLLSIVQELVSGKMLKKDYEKAAAAQAEQERLEKEEEKRKKKEAAERRALAAEEAKKNKGKKKPAEKSEKKKDRTTDAGRIGMRPYARGRAYEEDRYGGVTAYQDPGAPIDEEAVEQALAAKGKLPEEPQEDAAQQLPEQTEEVQEQVTEQEKSAPESSEILPDESGEADEAEESGEEEEADEDEETEE